MTLGEAALLCGAECKVAHAANENCLVFMFVALLPDRNAGSVSAVWVTY